MGDDLGLARVVVLVRPSPSPPPRIRMPRQSGLAKQLRAIAQEDHLVRGVLAGSTHRPSFLFSPQEAADYDDASIYALGLEGMEVLCQQDPSLRGYRDHVFDALLVETDTSRWNRKERSSRYDPLRYFLFLLSPHFMSKDAHKVLEWMVRKWRINEVMVDDLMISILPYHDSTAFVRMVQIVFFTDGSTWSFLFDKVKRAGSPVNRTLLAQRCSVDPEILNMVSRALTFYQKHSSSNSQYNLGTTFITFATFLMMETLAVYKKFPDMEAIRFYQRIEAILHHGTNSEAVTGAMMLFLSLAERAELSESACNFFINRIVAIADSSIHRQVLLMISRVVEAGYVEVLSDEAIAFVASKADMVSAISTQFPIERFLTSVCTTCAKSESDSIKQLGASFANQLSVTRISA